MSILKIKTNNLSWLTELQSSYFKTRKIKPADVERLVLVHNDIVRLVYQDEKEQQMRMIDKKMCTTCSGGANIKRALKFITDQFSKF